MCVASGLALLLVVSTVSGPDLVGGLHSFILLVAIAVVGWIASRRPPSPNTVRILGLGLAALTLFGIWQLAFGFERAIAQVDVLPAALQEDARALMSSGRVFASQLFPGHLAVLLVTALPLLLFNLRSRSDRFIGVMGTTLCIVGIGLTRSPIGGVFALCVTMTFVAKRGRAVAWLAPLGAVVILAVAVVLRGDVLRLEPVLLRIENWKAAVWTWSTAPFSGVGWGGFGQAAQAVPFDVGNRPVHAHSLPLEWLADLGLVGVLFAIVFFSWLVRLVLSLWHERPDLAVAIAVVPLHNLVDFSLYVSGTALPWAVIVGWAIAVRRGSVFEEQDNTRGRLVLVALAAVAVAVSLLHFASNFVERSIPGVDDVSERVVFADTAMRLAPWRLSPKLELASRAIESGRPEDFELARHATDQARRLRPRSASVAAMRESLALASGVVDEAVASAWWAQREQPARNVYRKEYEDLVETLEAAAGGHER
ncbi:MAG: O-antigen ligase family protein [bacterium]|nr:O-antigen ligase family protein [bacterium]